MLHSTSRIFHLKSRYPERPNGFGDLVRYRLRKSRAERAMLDLVFEMSFRHWRPATLLAEPITDLLEMREEVLARLFVRLSNLARRMYSDIIAPGRGNEHAFPRYIDNLSIGCERT
jgi:hypothetical protein